MALRAGLGEVCRYVVGIGRALVVLQVAGDASTTGEVVIIVHVTIGTLAWGNGMHASQGEAGRVMIERRLQP